MMSTLEGQSLKHFRIEKLLGRGGMGVVYLGRDTRLDRPVAIKVLRPDLTANRERQSRFFQEARSAAAVTHPAIAQIYDVDEADGNTFIAMEYVEGKTVSQLIANQELDLIGAVAYMSPEQARGKSVTQSSDVFSLGIVLYEMIAGELPFKGESPLDTMHAIAFDEARPVTLVRKNLPPESHRILQNCLRKRPEDRYPDAGALAVDLKRLKKELESGVQRSMTIGTRFQGVIDWVKFSLPFGVKGISGLTVLLILAVIIIFTKINLWVSGSYVLVVLIIYRYIRNRKHRMLKKFTANVSKFPEVRAIRISDDQIVVIVDEAKAKLYLRINSLVEAVNRKIYFGKPVKAAVRDDLPNGEFQQILRESGIVYVREDIVLKSKNSVVLK